MGFKILALSISTLRRVRFRSFFIVALALLTGIGTLYSNTAQSVSPSEVLMPPECDQDFDSVTAPALPPGWTTTSSGAEVRWVTSPIISDTAPNNIFAPDPGSVGESDLVSPSYTISAGGGSFSFRNNYSTETSYDGMVLEIRVNGGTYQDILAAGGSFSAGGYNGVISTEYMNPLAGRQAWTGNSNGYLTTTVNLPAAANGQMINLRWRMGTDTSFNAIGVRIDTVAGIPCTSIIPTPTPTGAPTPTPLPPTLAEYPDTIVHLGSNATIVPSATPTDTTNIEVSTSTSFLGNLAADPVSGILRITNAHHANLSAGSYIVTVRAIGPGGSTVKSFALTVTDGTACAGSSSFRDGGSVGVGRFSKAIAVGDFNNDNRQDIVVANGSSNDVSIRLGNGLGGFSGNIDIPTGLGTRAVAVADLNGDGNEDIAVANWDSTVAILLGDGTGNFVIGGNVGGGGHGDAVAIADFNHDGIADIAFTSGNAVFIRLGNGRGGFSGTTTANLASIGSSMAIGDFNNDNNPDIAITNGDANLVSIVLGDGHGGISSVTTLTGGFNPNSVAVGDFNLDGKQDLAISYQGSGIVATRMGDGLGGFADPTYVSAGSNPFFVAVGDFNNDGRQDIAVADENDTGSISIRYGDGLGGLTGTDAIPAGPGTRSLAIGDFNNDGRQDIAAACGTVSYMATTIHLGTCAAPTPTPTPFCSLTQGFNDFQNPVPPGWYALNLSIPLGIRGWSDGDQTLFPPQGGAAFIADDSLATAGTGTISNWLISPVVNMRNGGTVTFYTRTVATSTRPDRLQLRLSTSGESINVGQTATSVGDFTTLLLDINPTYTTTGYPVDWTQFTVNLTGISGQAAGRFALRYFVENGGSGGSNSDYIGVDTFAYNSGICPSPTATPVPSSTATPVASSTVPTTTPTATPSQTITATPTASVTPSATPTNSPIGSPTNTPTATPTTSPTPRRATACDYDGDHRSDISVYRPCEGNWYLQRSAGGPLGINFGLSTDRITPTDFDGDGKTDIAVYRPSTGIWYVFRSSDGTFSYTNFGLAEDLPVPADYDGDGKADIAVFRPSTSTWYRQNSSDGSFYAIQFGSSGDKPTVGDFDGDGKADIAIFRPSVGAWYHINSSNGTLFGEQFGFGTDIIVPADYDGDGKTDLAVFRPSNGFWYIKNSATTTYTAYPFGLSADIPAPGDFDGDGKADLSVFRPSDGNWYRLNSSNGTFTSFPFGTNGDKPTQTAFRY